METMEGLDKQYILLTGATGFLGSRVLHFLTEAGYKVVACKRSTSDTKRVLDYVDHPAVVWIDIDMQSKKDIFELYTISHIIHAATCYGRSGESEQEITEANFELPKELLELGIQHGVKAFINSDTFSNEKIEMRAKENLYVRTKKQFLNHAKETVQEIGTKFINMGIEQMYGPCDNATKFIPFVIRELIAKKDSVDFTPGEQKRDFVYVDDVAQAYVAAVQHTDACGEIQEIGVGTGTSTMLKDAVEIVHRLMNSYTVLNFGGLAYRGNEIMSHAANLSENEKINWKAEVSLEQGLKKTIDWYTKQI